VKYESIPYLLVHINKSITVFAQFLDSEADGKYYEVNGAKLWTLSFGEGEPLFFIAADRAIHITAYDISTRYQLQTNWFIMMLSKREV